MVKWTRILDRSRESRPPVKTRTLLWPAVLVLQFAPSASGAISDLDARVKAKEAIRAEAKRGNEGLFVIRLEKFEDEFLTYQVPIYEGRVGKGIYVYEVSSAGCDTELNDKGFRACAVVVDADPRWYVAVSRESGIAYRLSGFDDSRQEFNRMASDLHIHLNKPADAKNYGLFFLLLLYGPETTLDGPQVRPVETEYSLRRAAEDDFHSMYKELEYETRFDDWWSRFKKVRPKLALEARNNSRDDGHEVSISALKLMSFSLLPFKRLEDEPTLERINLKISPKGTIDQMELHKVFR